MSDSRNRTHPEQEQHHHKKRKRKRKKGNRLLRNIILFVVICGFIVGGATLGILVGVLDSTALLNTEDVVPENYNSIIYDTEGNQVDKLHGRENREYVKLEEVPQSLQDAVVAIEDERFYQHNGIDVKGIFRAMAINLKTFHFSQGASTLTQQLIKNEELSQEKTLIRKVKEQYLALSLESNLKKQLGSTKKAKDYILELYLNSIALNHGLNGVQTASMFYYGKDVSELTLAESASIAGITKNPSLYSPVSHPDKNKERQQTILKKMLSLDYITQEEYDAAIAEDIYANIVGKLTDDTDAPSHHSYFVDALIVQIAEDLQEQKKMSKSQAYDMIYSGGLEIESTLDTNIQSIMEDSFQNDSLFPPKGNTWDVSYTVSVADNKTGEQTHHTKTTTVTSKDDVDPFVESVKAEFLNDTNTLVLDKLLVNESLQASMVIMDFHNGEVKGLVGGRGEKHGDLVFNRATQAFRQPGSCIKPLVAYGPALDLGLVKPSTIIVDEPLKVGGYQPQNWNKKFLGPCTVRQGIRDSMNILAVKTLMMVGIDKGYEYLEKFGLTQLDPVNDKGLSLALGGMTNGVSALELTGAYSAIANEGNYIQPRLYTKVYDHSHNLLLETKEDSTPVISKNAAFMLTDMLEDVIRGGGSATGRLANFSGMSIAGKTGTTNEDKDLSFAGFTPYYCGGIWMGYDNPKPLNYDKSYHLLLWKDIMKKVHKDLPNKSFGTPENTETVSICTLSGGKPTDACSSDYYGGNLVSSDYGSADEENAQGSCKYHKSFKICSETGQIATEFCPNATSVSLAIDPDSGKIMNKPSPVPSGKLDIQLSTCTVHSKPTETTPSPEVPETPPAETPPTETTPDGGSNTNSDLPW